MSMKISEEMGRMLPRTFLCVLGMGGGVMSVFKNSFMREISSDDWLECRSLCVPRALPKMGGLQPWLYIRATGEAWPTTHAQTN